MLEEIGVQIDAAVSLLVDDADIESRMAARRVCPVCGAVFSLSVKPPAKEGVCDLCGAALIIRDDDKPETVRERLRVYHEETEPIIGFYREKGKLKEVAASAGIEQTTKALLETLRLGN
jgi:adenylate kinase